MAGAVAPFDLDIQGSNPFTHFYNRDFFSNRGDEQFFWTFQKVPNFSADDDDDVNDEVDDEDDDGDDDDNDVNDEVDDEAFQHLFHKSENNWTFSSPTKENLYFFRKKFSWKKQQILF